MADELEFFRALGGDTLIDDIREYERKADAYSQRYARQQDDSAPWLPVGGIESVETYEGGVRLFGEFAAVDLRWIGDNCVRVRVRPDGKFAGIDSDAVIQEPKNRTLPRLSEEAHSITVQAGRVICRVERMAYNLSITNADGQTHYAEAAGPRWQPNDGAVQLELHLPNSETCHGLGERMWGLNLRGRRWGLWNADQQNFMRGDDPIHYSVPFYLGVNRAGVYGILWDNPWRGYVDAGAEADTKLRFQAEGGELRYYVIIGPDLNSVMGRYADLTGHITLPPLWALGNHQARFSYMDQAELLEIAKTFREKQIPCDALYLDIHYMDNYKVFTWDTERFADLPGTLRKLKKQGFKVVAILDPGVKVEEGYPAYEEGLKNDVFLHYPDGDTVTAYVWPGACHLPDFALERTRDWWRDQMKTLIDAGVDGIWNDMNEPAVFRTDGPATLSDAVQHADDLPHARQHNLYGMQMGQASLQALEQLRPGKRQLNIIRAGYAGAQRYASSWTGDNTSDWDHLHASIAQVINMGLSGAPMTGPDIGGFHGDSDGELLVRWTQAASLMPFFRNHSGFGSARQEPWGFGEPYDAAVKSAIELRYQLMPYLYAIVAQCREYGWPIVRPLFAEEIDNAPLRDIDDAYMLGNALLVAPVVEPGAENRIVYLPKGRWFNYWTGVELIGGREINVPAPLDHLPLFVRSGAVIPTWPMRQHFHNTAVKDLSLRVFPGNLETILYEDHGEDIDYREGNYRWVYLTSAWESNVLTIRRRTAGRYEPGYERIQVEVLGFDEEPREVRVDRQGAPVWFYDAGRIEMAIEPFEQIEITRQIGPSDQTVVRRPWQLR